MLLTHFATVTINSSLTIKGPPARAAPLPPRKTTAPAGVFQQKLDYDASHMWRNTTEEDDESDDGLAIPWEGTTVDSKYSIGKEIGRFVTGWSILPTHS